MGAPLELAEGRIKRLHISGDWSYSAGIRPRIEISGVRVVARVRPPHATPRPPGTKLQSHGSSATGTPKPQASVLRSLLRRICCELTDLQFVAVDSLAECHHPASFGFTVQSISTETPVATRPPSPNVTGAPSGASTAGGTSAHSAAAGMQLLRTLLPCEPCAAV